MPGQRHPSQVTITLPGEPQRELLGETPAVSLDTSAFIATSLSYFEAAGIPASTEATALVESTWMRLLDATGAAEAVAAVPELKAFLAAAVAGFVSGSTGSSLCSEGSVEPLLAAEAFARALVAFSSTPGPSADGLLDAALKKFPQVYPYLMLETQSPPMRSITAEFWSLLSPAERLARVLLAVFGIPLRLASGAAKWLLEAGSRTLPLRVSYLKCAATCCLRTGAAADMRRCGGCKSVYYCSADCAKAAWPSHKTACAATTAANTTVETIDSEVPDLNLDH
jgi:hypothetical protein